jgi:polyhydroxybutyrate depolymerase
MTPRLLSGAWRRFAAGLALLALGACGDAPSLALVAEGRLRSAVIERPPGPPGPRPLLIVLHGAALSGAVTRDLMRLPALAPREGIALAFPDAAGLVWNEASLARELPALLSGGDDVAFLDALIDRLVAEGIADPAAIHLAGISNGGMMAARYACLRAGRIASLAMFKATMPPAADPPCRPSRPLPVMLVAGTEDPVVRWDGTVVLGGAVTLQRRRSVPDSFAFWRASNGCTGVGPEQALPRRGPADGPAVLLHSATGCAGGVPTLLYEVRGGGHRLPGGEELSVLRVLGRATQDLEASALLLDFVRAAGEASLRVPD